MTSTQLHGLVDARLIGVAKCIRAACREGHLKEAKRLLQGLGMDRGGVLPLIHRALGFDESALVSAVRDDRVAVVKFLIEAGADVNEVVHGASLLVFAVRRSSFAVVRQLVEAGAIVNPAVDAGGRTALSVAIVNGYEDIALYLLEAGARFDEGLRFELLGNAPVSMLAAQYDLPELFLELCRRGAIDGFSVSPLRRAIEGNGLKVVQACLDDPLLCRPAQGQALDPDLLHGAGDEVIAAVLSWRSSHVVGLALSGPRPDEVLGGSCAPSPRSVAAL